MKYEGSSHLVVLASFDFILVLFSFVYAAAVTSDRYMTSRS